ncbi:MAG: hypothetical protein GWP14_07630, partial [Actinobacteria bacterium]|nr:hypothetical protein [Actinomycetota bacterium]
LIAAAFPAGVAMSIAVSDETTSQAVFQEAVAEIKDNIGQTELAGVLGANLVVMPYGSCEREFNGGPFSWSALIRRASTSTTGPMGNLCQVVIVVSREPSGNPGFLDNSDNPSGFPELRTVACTGTADERMLTVTSNFGRVPSAGYIIDGQTGAIYSIISRNEGATNTVTLLTPLPADISTARNFWVIPGPYDGTNYGRSSPAIRVFQTMLYLP